MFLTEREVARLTGFGQPSRQIRWLQAKGISFHINGKGLPVVPKDAVYQAAPREYQLGVVR